MDDRLVEVEDALVGSADTTRKTVRPENRTGDRRNVGEGGRIVFFGVEDFLDVEEFTMPKSENGRLAIGPLLVEERAFGETFERVDDLEDVGKTVGGVFNGHVHDVAELLFEFTNIEPEALVILVEGVIIDIKKIVSDLLKFTVLLGEGSLDFFDFISAVDTSVGTDLEVGETEEETADVDEIEQIVATFEEGIHAAEKCGVLEAPRALEFLDSASLVQEKSGLEFTTEGEDGSELLLDFFGILVEDIHDVEIFLGILDDIVGDFVDEVGHFGDGGKTRAVGPDQEEKMEQLTENLLLGDDFRFEVGARSDFDHLERFAERLEITVDFGGFFERIVEFVDERSESRVEVRVGELEDDDRLDDERLTELLLKLHQVLSLAFPETDLIERADRTTEKRRKSLLGNSVDGFANEFSPLGDG